MNESNDMISNLNRYRTGFVGTYFASSAGLNQPAKLMILEEHLNRRYTAISELEPLNAF
jgi:hypothetical protein